MATGSKYVRKISSVKYGLKTSIMTRLKDEEETKTKGQAKIVPDHKTFNKI